MRIKLHLYNGLLPLGLLIALLSSLPASAQNALSNPLADLYACQIIETVIARSECYDRATKALQNAQKQGAIITLKAEEFREIQEDVFGYRHTLLTRRDIEDIANTNTLESITIPVKKVERYLSGYVITLDNNQVWEQFAGNISRLPKGKLSAEIKTTPTGTYKMTLFNAKRRISNIKVRRIQ